MGKEILTGLSFFLTLGKGWNSFQPDYNQDFKVKSSGMSHSSNANAVKEIRKR